tara:strand:+ start:560 stop:808 length:249 start_codon:yes stop_codon:yes gene_type:complete
MDELLNQSMQNIESETRSREIDKYEHILSESIKEIKIAKDLVKKFSDIRNESIKNLYRVGISAKKLSESTGLSTVFIHRILK